MTNLQEPHDSQFVTDVRFILQESCCVQFIVVIYFILGYLSFCMTIGGYVKKQTYIFYAGIGIATFIIVTLLTLKILNKKNIKVTTNL